MGSGHPVGGGGLRPLHSINCGTPKDCHELRTPHGLRPFRNCPRGPTGCGLAAALRVAAALCTPRGCFQPIGCALRLHQRLWSPRRPRRPRARGLLLGCGHAIWRNHGHTGCRLSRGYGRPMGYGHLKGCFQPIGCGHPHWATATPWTLPAHGPAATQLHEVWPPQRLRTPYGLQSPHGLRPPLVGCGHHMRPQWAAATRWAAVHP